MNLSLTGNKEECTYNRDSLHFMVQFGKYRIIFKDYLILSLY